LISLDTRGFSLEGRLQTKQPLIVVNASKSVKQAARPRAGALRYNAPVSQLSLDKEK